MSKKNARALKLEEEKRKQAEEEKIRQLAEEREKNLLLIQKEARENALRKAIIEDSLAVFDDLFQKVLQKKKDNREEENWKKYLKCEKIPDTKIPAETRNFLYKFDQEFFEHHFNNINWWLKCDKNSIMTQDLQVPDTRRQTIDLIREPIGKFYDQKFRFMMRVYESLEDTLRRKKVPKNHLDDLITIQSSFREKALHFLDALTFEILMGIDREMKSISPLAAQYSYSSPDFIEFIWSLKDVPPPDDMSDKHRKIVMQPLQMNVTMSNLLDLETTSVRVLWFKRDFYSDYCPSFLPASFDMKFESLDDAIDRETKMRKYFRDKRLDEMRRSREEYENKMEILRQQQEAEEAAKKKDKTASAKTHTKKVSKSKLEEPPIVDESTNPDIEEEYLEYENEKLEEEREELSPASLNLVDGDLNMREYQIIGGIYKIECLEKPLQTREIYQHMFIRLNERPNILKYKHFHHIYKEPVLKNIKEERKTLFAEKILNAKKKELSGLIRVDLKLSDKIIWWEMPKVCRWEPWEESDEFRNLHPDLQDYNVNYEKYQERERKKLWKVESPESSQKIKLKDFKLSSHPNEMKLSELVRFYLSPIMSHDYLCYTEKLEMFETKQREWMFFKARQEEKLTNVENNEEMKNLTIQAVSALDEFLKLFDMKYSRPRDLFPVKLKGRIEVFENPKLRLAVSKARREIQKLISKGEEFPPEFDDEIPIRDEPLMLSELLQRFKDLHEKLLPVFREIHKSSEQKVENAEVPRKSIKRTSTKKPQKVRINSKVTLADGTETVTESSTSDNTKLHLIPHHKGKWVTKDIHEESYDEEKKIFTFYTGRCGTFGLAIKKYLNLPFKKWEMTPICDESVEKYVLMRIEGQKVSIEFKITDNGFTFKILKPGKTPMQEMNRAVKIFELKKILTSLNINLFPELDAGWYVKNISEKHTATEFHTYKSMASFCLSHNFESHEINRFVTRREILIKSKLRDKKNFTDILITPLHLLTVDVENDDQFTANPAEQEFCPDLLSHLKAEVDKSEHRVNQKSFMTIWHAQALLLNLRPLSFTQ